jgi:hypothetical protein
VVAGPRRFFITLGGPQAHDSSGPTARRGRRDDKFVELWTGVNPLDNWHFRATNLSSQAERIRISCRAALDMATCAAFVKESRIKIANATKLNRKSGVAQ